MKKIILFFFILHIQVYAQLRLPHYFSDNMVVQRETLVPIWGWASPKEKITVTFHHQKIKTTADTLGQWTIYLQPELAGGPYTLTVKGKQTRTLTNVLVGDVWFAGGQSNMEWRVYQSDNYKEERERADFPAIRHIKIQHDINTVPQHDVLPSNWAICTQDVVGDFSGVGYYFAKEIYQKTHIPIGILNVSWGGSMIETWMSKEALNNSDEFHYLKNTATVLNFEDIKNQKVTQIERLQNHKLTAFDTETLLQTDFDDTSLPTMIQPKGWESQALGNLDGVVWIRKTIELPHKQAEQNAILSLSRIDDEDITYVNGIKIGENKVWNEERQYYIPSGILKSGKNVIAIKITDTGGGGGLWGEPEKVFLQIGEEKIALAGNWKFFVKNVFVVKDANSFQSLAYNAMVNPLVNFPVKGFIWYQGESNAPRAYQYRTAFPLLIEDWRKKWKSELPFYYVQLATYKTTGNSNVGCDWAELREAQTLTLQIPKTGMVVTTDIGNPFDIHPTNKHDVGKRLAQIALHNEYKITTPYQNVSFKLYEIKENQLVVYFDNFGDYLVTPNDELIKGFEIADESQKFQTVTGRIATDENGIKNKVIIDLPPYYNMQALRFGWIGDASECNLFNSYGLPLIPFRTDAFNTLTKEVKFNSN